MSDFSEPSTERVSTFLDLGSFALDLEQPGDVTSVTCDDHVTISGEESEMSVDNVRSLRRSAQCAHKFRLRFIEWVFGDSEQKPGQKRLFWTAGPPRLRHTPTRRCHAYVAQTRCFDQSYNLAVIPVDRNERASV
jgi:hypothetical protein